MRKIEMNHNETDCSLTFPPLTDSEIAYLKIRKYLREEKEIFVSALRQELIRSEKKLHKIEIETTKLNTILTIFKRSLKPQLHRNPKKKNAEMIVMRLRSHLERAEKDLVNTYLMPLDIGKRSKRTLN